MKIVSENYSYHLEDNLEIKLKESILLSESHRKIPKTLAAPGFRFGGESRCNGWEGGPAGGAGVHGQSFWWGLGRSPGKFPKLAKFFIAFSLKINLKFHKKYNFFKIF